MAELVAKTAAEVTLATSYTTLLDWVNIEKFAGDLTLVVENTGETLIKSVNFHLSNDGGDTYTTNEFISDELLNIDRSATKRLTSITAKYIKFCARTQTETTTANAFLFAEFVTGRLCTLADVKDRLGINNTDYDALIHSIIAGIEGTFNAFCNRELILNTTDVTEYYTAERGVRRLCLRRYPVVSITSIKESYDYDFDTATALVENTDYRVVNSGKNGILLRVYSDWATVDEDGIQIVYRGGYCSAGQTPAAGQFALPAEIREAAIIQSSFLYKRKDDLGLSGTSFDGGSISKFAPIELLPIVRDTLKKYRRTA